MLLVHLLSRSVYITFLIFFVFSADAGQLDPDPTEVVEYVYEYAYEDSGSSGAHIETEADIDSMGRSANLPTSPQQNNVNANRAKNVPPPEPARPVRKYGFSPRPGFLVRKNLAKPIMTKLLVNQTSSKYGCPPRDIAQTARAERVLSNEPLVLEGLSPLERLKVMSDRIEGIEDDVSDVVEAKVETIIQNSPFKKRPTFREIQEEKARKRLEQKKEMEAVKPKFILGTDCERLLCGSCRVLVEEVGNALKEKIHDPKVLHVDQVFEKFCESQNVLVKYDDIVGDLCAKINDPQYGYKDVLIDIFDKEKDFEKLNNLKSLFEKEWSFCGETLQVCGVEDFRVNFKPKSIYQKHWDSTCYICQEFIKMTEERVQLQRRVTDRSISGVIAPLCDLLQLDSEHDVVCREIINRNLDELSWLAKTHEESVSKGEKSEIKWPDKMCEGFKYCTKWIDPNSVEEDDKKEDEEDAFY